jgi:hypothetical protein
MEQLTPTLKRKPIQILWIVLSCIPFLNWIGFLLLGSATNQKKWTILGYVHFALSLVSAGLFASCVINYDYLANPFSDFDKLFPYLMFISWLIGVVQAWWISGEAKKRLERQFADQQAAPFAELIPMTKKERIQSNLVYLLFVLVPFSGLSLAHVGKTIQRKKLQIFGWVSFALCILLEIASVILFLNTYSPYASLAVPLWPFYIALTQMPVLLLWVVALLLCIRTKSEYTSTSIDALNTYNEGLRQRKQEFEQLKLLYPCLQSTAWKIKHSVHLLWCLPLITSPIALIHIGISDRKWKRLTCGIGSLIYYVIFIIVSTEKFFEDVIYWLFDPLLILMGILWSAIIWFSIASLRSHLIYAAERCGGYVDSFDAEQARLEQAEQISAPEGGEKAV